MEEYLGFKEVAVDDDTINDLYAGKALNTFDLLQNEYMIAKDQDGKDIGLFKCDNEWLIKVPFGVIQSRYLGKIKPRNTQQKMAIDMLNNRKETIKILTGPFGSGKSMLMAAAAIELIEKGEFEKIVYVRNNIEVRDSKPIGFLPGTYLDKMLPFAMPLADAIGGVDGLEIMMKEGKLEIVHLGFIRGRDIKRSIIMCSECENMTKEHIQLLIGRVGEGSELWLDGDFKQCDSDVFKYNSGLSVAIDRLKGHSRFGYVKLLKTERSETAAMADLLD